MEKNLKNKYDSKLTTLSKELKYLESRNIISKFPDHSIATGRSIPYKELENIYNTSTDYEIKMTVLSEILWIINWFASMTRIKGIRCSYMNSQTQKKFTVEDFPTEALIEKQKTE